MTCDHNPVWQRRDTVAGRLQAGRGLGIAAWCVGVFVACVIAQQFCAAQDLRAHEELSRLASSITATEPAITLSPSGTYVTQHDPRGAVWLLTPRSGHRLLLQQSATAAAIVWAADSGSLLIAEPGSAWVYRIPQGGLIAHLRGGDFNNFPSVAPDGRHFAFIQAHNVWLAKMDGGAPTPLTHDGSPNFLAGEADPLFAHEFDVEKHFWWSPDGRSIALIDTEFPDADHYPIAGARLPTFQLRVVNVATGASRILAASSEAWPYLLRVAWHPDGRQVAAYRMNRAQNIAELTLYNIDSNDSRSVATVKDDYWVNAPETPVFLDHGEHLVVSSERSGYRALYLYDVNGSQLRELTPADMEVYRLDTAVDAAGGVFVEASTGNHQERNLYRIDTASGNCTQLTKQRGRHDVSLDAAGNAYIDRFSSAAEPPSIIWNGPHGSRRVMVKAAGWQGDVTGEYLTIPIHDATLLPARLFKPRDFTVQKQYPLIVYTYSGPHGRVVEDAWGGWQMAWNRYMAHKGYLVLAVDLRGSSGYGHSFEEYLHIRLGAQETADLHEVIDYLQTLPFVNRQRLGVWGFDYGAFVALHGMMEIPGGFRAGFADSPILDWTRYDAYFVERYLGLPGQHAHEYDDSSPLDNARRMTGAVLIAASPINPFIRADQLAALDKVLKRRTSRSIADRVHRLDFAGHGYHTDRTQLEALYDAMTEFFIRAL